MHVYFGESTLPEGFYETSDAIFDVRSVLKPAGFAQRRNY